MIDTTATVREFAVRHPRTLAVFERHGIDYCCGGGDLLQDAVAKRGVPLAQLVGEIEQAIAQPPDPTEERCDWTAARLSELTDHIVGVHHTFMKAELPKTDTLLGMVVTVHGPAHGDMLRPLQETLRSLEAEVERHLRKEEQDLFPGIREVESKVAAGEPTPPAVEDKLAGLVEETVAEHDLLGAALDDMRDRTSNYTLPADACPTFARVYEGLQAIEKDVHRHVHLENNILFPRLAQLQHQRRSRPA